MISLGKIAHNTNPIFTSLICCAEEARLRVFFPNPNFKSPAKHSKCFLRASIPARPQSLQSSLAAQGGAMVGETGAATNEFTSTELSFSTASGSPTDKGEPLASGKKADAESDEPKMIRVCDKLIEVFMVDKPSPTDWRRLLAFSKEWDNIRPNFYRRCQDRADSEDDPEMKHRLLRLARKLKEVDEDVQRHNELLEVVKGAPSEINEVVARHRKDFTKEFFVHLHAVVESYYENPTEQNALAKIGNTCLAAVQSYDTASENIEALNAAELKFQDIINSPSLDAACRKIDNLAAKNQLDSALVLMITKAWSAAKESNMMKEERLMPKEIRIIKYLLTIKDPEEQLSALKDAFTPGEELEGKDVDCLYTTPVELHTWIKTVVDAYHFSREGTLIREAKDLMNPNMIQRLEELDKLIQSRFM
ncbi:hypothetical protein RJ641_024073 [Dillenia turbinata]|uniref:Uncharacterized protein n=1 Tax=Dillenia turbinata TaxID=194707 RepID=A0AAN8UAN7_9MAGN